MRITTRDDVFPALIPLRVFAWRAGEVLMRHYNGNIDVQHKTDGSEVTIADTESEDYLLKEIGALFPGIPIVSEEAVSNGARPDLAGKTFITVDPLDGTKEFTARTGGFAVAIGIVIDGQAAGGVIYQPALKVMYCSDGVYAMRIDENGISYIHTRQPAEPPHALLNGKHGDHGLVYDFYTRLFGNRTTAQAFRENTQDVCTLDPQSGVFRSCQIAEGSADLFAYAMQRNGKTFGGYWWDTVPGQAIVESAGGIMLDFNGKPIRYDPKTSPDFWSPAYVIAGSEKLLAPIKAQSLQTGGKSAPQP